MNDFLNEEFNILIDAYITFFESFRNRYSGYPRTGVADSGYGSEENYSFMDKRGIETYVKYNRFHIEHRAHYTPDPFSQEALYYDKQHDYYVCPMGQQMTRVGTKYKKTESSYVSEKAVYSAQRCERCKLWSQCHTAKGNRTIEVRYRLAEYRKKSCPKAYLRKRHKAQETKTHRAGGRFRTDEVRHGLQEVQAFRD